MAKSVSKFIVTVFSAAFLFAASGLGMALEASAKLRACQKTYNAYFLKKPGHKALATSGGRPLTQGDLACGISFGQPTTKAAIAVALRYCQAQARQHKVKQACRVIEMR
jgi:hypothetical protein